MGTAHCNDQVRLKSWKGDYLNRPDSPQGVTTNGVRTLRGNTWTVQCHPDGNVSLRSWKGDYLHRPDGPGGVTTWDQGEWTVVPGTGDSFMLRSWKGDYLHRPDSPEGVTTWDQGTWTVEVGPPAVMGSAHCGDEVRLKSWQGDYLSRPDSPQGVTIDAADTHSVWTVECKPDGNISLRSWKGDYLHRPDSPGGVTTWDQGEWTVVPTADGGFMLRSWKGDYLHRPAGPPAVTTWEQGTWTAEVTSPAVMGSAHCGDEVRLKSWQGDYLSRPDSPQGVTSDAAGFGSAWTVECRPDGNISLRSWKGDYLHRPDSPGGVTTWAQGEWAVVPTVDGGVMLRSWKGDFLHRPAGPPGVTTWDQGTWTAQPACPAGQISNKGGLTCFPQDLPARFAPRLRFDGEANNYPMAAQPFFDADIVNHQTARINNTDASTVGSGMLPTYYQVISCGNQVRIKYWWFYGYQSACDIFGNGTHDGDWEDVTVTLSEDQSRIAAITFTMHGHTYTRLATRGGFDVEAVTHPVVYVAQNSHASIFEQGGSGGRNNLIGCLPMEESSNNTSGLHMDSWQNLVNLDTGMEPWMVADWTALPADQGGFVWGPDGISNHPTQHGPSCSMKAADWTTTVPTWQYSQCREGDDDNGLLGCMAQCKPGYFNGGLGDCVEDGFPWLDIYGRDIYAHDYTLPTSDVGLLTSAY
jgi:hypothetical protein